MSRPLAFLAALALSSLTVLPARADRLDDDLATVWEALWDERGTPWLLTRWEQPVRWRVLGSPTASQRGAITAALAEVAQLTRLDVRPAVEPIDGRAERERAHIEFELLGSDEVLEHAGCLTETFRLGWAMHKATIRMAPSEAWGCTHHELMHAMGVPGHPSGKTVLSYFPWRRDAFMDLDRLLLAAWYDRRLTSGATPFEVLWVAGQHVAQQTDLRIDPERAEQRRLQNYAQRLREMEAFVRGEGNVPLIILRSNRASAFHIEEARGLMAHFLGLVHARGTGVAPDPVQAHRWLSLALKSGNGAAREDLHRLERTMDATLLEKARAMGTR